MNPDLFQAYVALVRTDTRKEPNTSKEIGLLALRTPSHVLHNHPAEESTKKEPSVLQNKGCFPPAGVPSDQQAAGRMVKEKQHLQEVMAAADALTVMHSQVTNNKTEVGEGVRKNIAAQHCTVCRMSDQHSKASMK